MPRDADPHGPIVYVEDDALGLMGLRYNKMIHQAVGDEIRIRPKSGKDKKRGRQAVEEEAEGDVEFAFEDEEDQEPEVKTPRTGE